jgi:hypothetical protein
MANATVIKQQYTMLHSHVPDLPCKGFSPKQEVLLA